MRKYYYLILLVLVIVINGYFRLQTAFLPFLKLKARALVNNQLAEEVGGEIEKKFKDLSPEIKAGLKNDLFRLWQKERKAFIVKSIREKEKELKLNFQDDNKNTFLLELDPYHWYRLVRNFSETGHLGDKIMGKKEYDSYMLAPQGMKVEASLHKNLHVYLASFLYKLCRLFKRNTDLLQVVFFIPVLISVLSVIALFFMCYSLTGNSIAGFFSCLSLGLAPIYLMRSMAGWFDTDPYIILFSILITWGYIYSLKNTLSLSRSLILIIFTALGMGLFSLTWDGWWYIFDLLIITTFYYLANLILLKQEFKTTSLIQKT
ncbi:MAG: hypothetical protein NC829_02255, partial [Candidatus Omnitrophica bacterium]|nr:hypothetical protein [Candidatus Omnitrophota bacterium]